jgi:hypothetical protein
MEGDAIKPMNAIRSTTLIIIIILSAVCMPPAVQSEQTLIKQIESKNNEDTYLYLK